jgi:RNA polymerase sigma-70 factor (ECF subfamily)
MSEATDEHPERVLVAALLAGDEAAFRDLVTRHHGALVRVASKYVASRAVAEEVVQETWVAVIRNLPRFEGRSSLKTWIFTILANQARSRGAREQRVVPMSSVAGADRGPGDELVPHPAVDPERFAGADHRWAGHWTQPPRRIEGLPEEKVDGDELRAAVERALADLPPNQQRVMWLRDVEGWASDEVCAALDLSEGNQRVLLHRARAKVRAALERQLEASLG